MTPQPDFRPKYGQGRGVYPKFTRAGQVLLWNKKGQMFAHWPVDAKAMVAAGELTIAPPASPAAGPS